MAFTSDRAQLTGSANRWSRFFGVSLRPWTGHSPWSLILRGVVQAVLLGIVLVFAVKMLTDPATTESEVSGLFVNWAWLMIIVIGVIALMAVSRVVIGVIDLVPRVSVTGEIVQLGERKFADFLPRMAQRVIFERNPNALDKRKIRTEVVVRTPEGVRQWTVRSAKIRRTLRVGDTVRLTVTPLAGYVASVETILR